MKEGAADISNALLPPEDGAVTRALRDLKTKVSTWSTAVASVQGALAARAAELVEMDPAHPHKPEPTDSQPDSAGAVQEEAEHQRSEDGSGERDAAMSVAEPTASSLEARDGEDPTQACAIEASPAEAGDDAPIASAPSPSEPVERSQEPAQDPDDEDQALLRSLDEKMSEAIRVQFRLFDGRKSVRELIDGYVEEPQEQQRSWWRRVKG